jgi:CO/xanthine dehydrogenase FAD-binding subunit
MDLNTVREVVVVRERTQLPAWRQGDAFIAGGSWLLSEAQSGLQRLVDITRLDWPPTEITTDGLTLAATCPVAVVSRLSEQLQPDWTAAPLFHQCCTALLASFKIWATATVGGNLCLSFPAGAVISLVTALDGVLTIWRPDGTDYSVPVTDFVTGVASNVLAPGDILRSVFLPASALRARTAYRKIALSELGRSGAVLIGRADAQADGGGFVLAVTGSTTRPLSLRFPGMPDGVELDHALRAIPEELWHDDAHGAPDWRRGVSSVLAHEIRTELE